MKKLLSVIFISFCSINMMAQYAMNNQLLEISSSDSKKDNYFPSGQLQTIFSDTILQDKKLKFFKEYFENGHLKITGYYLNGENPFGTWTYYYDNSKTEYILNYDNGKIDGSYKYFHNNGQLWTEKIYKDGLLIKVVSNYDKNGRKKDAGTIKNGTGKLYNYDTEGNLIETIEYIDGHERATGNTH